MGAQRGISLRTQWNLRVFAETRSQTGKKKASQRRLASPGEEVLQRSGLVLLLADHAVSLLLLHLPDARREGVDVVKHGLHGDGDFVRLLTERTESVF